MDDYGLRKETSQSSTVVVAVVVKRFFLTPVDDYGDPDSPTVSGFREYCVARMGLCTLLGGRRAVATPDVDCMSS